MNNSFKKLSCAVAASALLSACGNDSDDNSPSNNSNKADEFVATLESADFAVTADSLDGTWVAVSNTAATYSATTQNLSEEDVFSFTSVEIFMIDESEDGASVSVQSCSEEDNNPVTLDLDQNTGSFQITEESNLIDDLQGSALVIVESNTKLTVGEFNTEEIGSSYSENGTSTSTLIKISDSFTRSFGTVSVNDTTTTASCFYYETGAGDINLTENGATQQGGYSYEHIDIQTPKGYTELSHSTGTSGDFLDTEYSDLFTVWPTFIDADSDDEGTSSVINISENGPLNYAGSAEFTESEATTTFNINLSLLNN